MHLKSLTLRGFKSFASSTTLHFEPGITCVVGPNGSGKSNVVDALAWVMGEQGAKSLRGGRMDDVIFAGTAGRPALGRAEVVLTIDNTDGLLPIEYTEVTLSRTMFSGGGSEYAINGRVCRLLDVQELLSDSGIGREMHVVVGQGQLDSILTATPEERRGFVEEAAGVLKHRKRKEKALRKLDAMQANLTRVQDLTAELRRQLGPLGRQADIARRANVIQADLRDARLRLLADELADARAVLAREAAAETALRAHQADIARARDEASSRERDVEAEAQQAAAMLARAQECWYRLASLRERVVGTASLAQERARHLTAHDEDKSTGPDVDAIAREAAAVRVQEAELAAQAATARTTLDAAVAERADAESALDGEERRLASVIQAAADRREGLARLSGQVDGLRRRADAAEAELARLRLARESALNSAAEAEREFTTLETTIAGLSVGEQGLDAEHERLQEELSDTEAVLAAALTEQREAERERAALAARREALEMGLARRDGVAALLADPERIGGLRGSVAALLAVEPGWETAVATALGPAADAVAVESLDDAVAALRRLRDDDLGRAGMVVATVDDEESMLPPLPSGFRYLADLIIVPPWLRPAVTGLLRGVVAVDDLPTARALVGELPMLVAVTPHGDLLGRAFAAGGSAGTPSRLEVQAALEETADQLGRATDHVTALDDAVAAARRRRDHIAAQVGAALARLHESDAELSAVAEQLGALGHAARSAAAEAERLAAATVEAEAVRDQDVADLAELEGRLAAAGSADEIDAAPSTEPRDALASAAQVARQAETEARLGLRTVEERMRALTGRAEALERAASDEREARTQAAALAERRARTAAAAAAVARGAVLARDRLERSLASAESQRSALEHSRERYDTELSSIRQLMARRREELDEVTSAIHRDELSLAEHRMRTEALEARGLEEFGVDPDTLLGDYGPDRPLPVVHPVDGETTAPYAREEQLKRARAAERELALLGRVNPLALEEFAALEERHAFLVEQLEDLRRTRRDLLDIVGEVDDRVQQIFAAAYEDTAREFADVFARLFPGGEGRLVLTEPDDMLATGIDVEARPPGKRIKRLSLLSGGERALVAVAFLIALFKARPSPFYVLDEVEAALDEVNLGRLLEIYEELREDSQLIVVTHQQRTMEVADALYGVSMRNDGVTAVISQRIRETEPA
ncbi:MAG TPA: chromosome segregation protein SMC [Gaiellaceae bacterium]|nr:chromosome segregation protein SMC [Gaiellaceae bacterium]